MYGPAARVRVFLYLFGSMALFVGALALPFLIEEDVVRVGRGDGDGWRIQGGDPDLGTVGLRTGDPLRPPRALVDAPSAVAEATFRVTWDGEGPDPAVVYAFHVQHGALDPAAEGGTAWTDWFQLRRSDLPREALFTGTPGTEHLFRARTCTMLGACGEWSTTVTTDVAPDAPAPVVSLDLTPRAPAPAATLQGRVAVQWHYAHDGPGDAMVDVALLPRGGAAVPLYSGMGLSVTWDTTRHGDGHHTLRLTLRDGTHQVAEEFPVHIQNHEATADGDDGATASDPSAADATPHQTAEASGAGLVAAALGVLVAAVVTGRTRRAATLCPIPPFIPTPTLPRAGAHGPGIHHDPDTRSHRP